MSAIPDQLLSSVPQSLHQTVSRYWQDWSAACEAAGLMPET